MKTEMAMQEKTKIKLAMGNLDPLAFDKRIYTLASFSAAVHDVFGHMEDMRKASRGGRISKAFAEKVMLSVTRVNGCRYCSYGHAHAALAAGVSEAELRSLLEGELGDFPEDEAVALTFAQHYAESSCRPDQQAWQRLVAYYGPEAAQDILAYIRMITFGNLSGNTFDAFLSRLGGRPAPHSSLWNEIGVIFGGVFIILWEVILHFPARLVSKKIVQEETLGTSVVGPTAWPEEADEIHS